MSLQPITLLCLSAGDLQLNYNMNGTTHNYTSRGVCRFGWNIYYTPQLKCMCFCYMLQLILDAMFLFSLCLLDEAVLYSTLKFQHKCYWQF